MMSVDIPMIMKAACRRLLMPQPTLVALKDLQPGQFATIGGQIEKVTIFIRASFLLMRFFTYHEILFAFLIRQLRETRVSILYLSSIVFIAMCRSMISALSLSKAITFH
jgi:hypothetical protein